jgi:polysaccharide pyruvyl transferase CsaB
MNGTFSLKLNLFIFPNGKVPFMRLIFGVFFLKINLAKNLNGLGVCLMRVGIIGNYGHDNNGDEAILSGILTQLTEHLAVKKENIIVFSNNPENTTKRYGLKSVRLLHKKGNLPLSILYTVKESYAVMKQLDLLIIGGGGLLMDMYKRDAPLYSTLGQLGHYAGCKVAVYGVGAGPITTKLGAFFIKRLVDKANSVSVRDDQSKQLLHSIGIQKEVKVIGDPAFFVPSEKKEQTGKRVQKVAVTAVPYFSRQYWPSADDQKYNAYIKGMAQNLDRLVEEKGVKITFFSTKFPQDIEVTKDIFGQMNDQQAAVIMEDNLYPHHIVDICREHDLVIGTRLHSLILSVVAQTPIIGIGYHQKVQDFMRTIGKTENFVDIHSLHEQENQFLSLVEKMETDWSGTLQEFDAISQTFKAEAAKGIEQLKNLM